MSWIAMFLPWWKTEADAAVDAAIIRAVEYNASQHLAESNLAAAPLRVRASGTLATGDLLDSTPFVCTSGSVSSYIGPGRYWRNAGSETPNVRTPRYEPAPINVEPPAGHKRAIVLTKAERGE